MAAVIWPMLSSVLICRTGNNGGDDDDGDDDDGTDTQIFFNKNTNCNIYQITEELNF